MFTEGLSTMGCLHMLPVVNSAAVNTGVHVSFQISDFFFFFSGYISKSGSAGSYGNFSFLRNLHFIFHSGCTNFHCL